MPRRCPRCDSFVGNHEPVCPNCGTANSRYREPSAAGLQGAAPGTASQPRPPDQLPIAQGSMDIEGAPSLRDGSGPVADGSQESPTDPGDGPGVSLSIEVVERLSRALLFVKWLLVVPAYVVVFLYGIAVGFTTFLAFWVILITGRYPKGLFAFARGYMDLYTRTVAYFPLLLTDLYPLRFGVVSKSAGADHVLYEAEHPDRQSRVRLLVKLVTNVLAAVYLLVVASVFALMLGSVVAWFAILFTGKYPESLRRFTVSLLQWVARVMSWQYLMRDEWTLFAENRRTAIPVGAGAALSAVIGLALWVPLVGSIRPLEVGDCFDIERSATGAVTGIASAGCDHDHDAEIYAEYNHSAASGAAFPGDFAVVSEAQSECAIHFEAFVGADLIDSALTVFVIRPSEETWTERDSRSGLCAVVRIDHAPLRGTARDSGL